MPRKWREERVEAHNKKAERRDLRNGFERGGLKASTHVQAAAARREEETPKVDVLQSRLTRFFCVPPRRGRVF
jgi:hypothetical protein